MPNHSPDSDGIEVGYIYQKVLLKMLALTYVLKTEVLSRQVAFVRLLRHPR